MNDEMRAYVGFGGADEAALRAFWPHVEPRMAWIIDRFYARILAVPAAKEVLQHESQVESLKKTLAQWLREVLTGPWDLAYVRRRERIGTRHVEVGLPIRFMFAAMSGFAQDLEIVLLEAGSAVDAGATRTAVRRVTDLDLALMTGTFVLGREELQLAALQLLIVAHMPVSILLLDEAGKVTASTGAATRLLVGPDPIGRNWTEVLPPDLLGSADLGGLLASAVAAGTAMDLSRVDVHGDGGVRSWKITAVPLEHADARILLHLEDLSDAVQVEARLQQSEALARLGSLSASVAHELRNPLAGMSAALQVLQPSFDASDPRKGVLAKVDDQVRRLNGLVSDLLEFARPGQAHLRRVELGPVAESVRELVSPIVSPGVALEIAGSGEAFADPNLIHQILLNLVQNALHAQERSGLVRIELGPGLVAVEDDGSGVPEELQDQIFQPFFTTRTRGTGLGLAICQRSAHSMDATLALVPALALRGARFELRLSPAGASPSDSEGRSA